VTNGDAFELTPPSIEDLEGMTAAARQRISFVFIRRLWDVVIGTVDADGETIGLARRVRVLEQRITVGGAIALALQTVSVTVSILALMHR